MLMEHAIVCYFMPLIFHRAGLNLGEPTLGFSSKKQETGESRDQASAKGDG
jgi:hypothetical protein